MGLKWALPLSAHYGLYKRGRDSPTNPSRHLKKERSDLPLKWLLKEGRGRSPTAAAAARLRAAAAAATTAATPCPGHGFFTIIIATPPSSRSRRRPQAAAAAASGLPRRHLLRFLLLPLVILLPQAPPTSISSSGKPPITFPQPLCCIPSCRSSSPHYHSPSTDLQLLLTLLPNSLLSLFPRDFTVSPFPLPRVP